MNPPVETNSHNKACSFSPVGPDSKTSGGATPEWSPDGKELYYVSPKGILMAVDVRVEAHSLTFQAPREQFASPVRAAVERYGVSPRGEFLVRAPAGGARPIEVVVNWPRLAE